MIKVRYQPLKMQCWHNPPPFGQRYLSQMFRRQR